MIEALVVSVCCLCVDSENLLMGRDYLRPIGILSIRNYRVGKHIFSGDVIIAEYLTFHFVHPYPGAERLEFSFPTECSVPNYRNLRHKWVYQLT